MAYEGNPQQWIGRSRPGLGSGTPTAEQREAKFQDFLAREAADIAAGRPAPPTASWPIEKRRELFFRRWGRPGERS